MSLKKNFLANCARAWDGKRLWTTICFRCQCCFAATIRGLRHAETEFQFLWQLVCYSANKIQLAVEIHNPTAWMDTWTPILALVEEYRKSNSFNYYLTNKFSASEFQKLTFFQACSMCLMTHCSSGKRSVHIWWMFYCFELSKKYNYQIWQRFEGKKNEVRSYPF